MNEQTLRADDYVEHAGYATFIKVWAALLALTGMLVLTSRLGQTYAVWGLLVLAPIKAGLVFYYFMHLKSRRRPAQGCFAGHPRHSAGLFRPPVL